MAYMLLTPSMLRMVKPLGYNSPAVQRKTPFSLSSMPVAMQGSRGLSPIWQRQGDAAWRCCASYCGSIGSGKSNCKPLHLPSSRLARHGIVHVASITTLLLPSGPGMAHNLEALLTPATCHGECKAVYALCASTCLCRGQDSAV